MLSKTLIAVTLLVTMFALISEAHRGDFGGPRGRFGGRRDDFGGPRGRFGGGYGGGYGGRYGGGYGGRFGGGYGGGFGGGFSSGFELGALAASSSIGAYSGLGLGSLGLGVGGLGLGNTVVLPGASVIVG